MSDNGIVLLQRKQGNETKRLAAKTAWTFDFEADDDFIPFPDASWLMAHVSERLLAHHVEAIAKGVDPATGQRVKALDPDGASGRNAKLGKRPDIRGIARTDGRDLASRLTRSKVTARAEVKIGKGRLGGSAAATIGAGTGGHGKYLVVARQDHGVDHLAIEGNAERVIDEATVEWLDLMLQGEPDKLPNFGRIEGRDL